ncbi:MAG: hypothetical protein HYY06_30465 [Deltaproteobacteria bacterium]|nr:hypothetical protein [Deltaproteobacteria bacterium]
MSERPRATCSQRDTLEGMIDGVVRFHLLGPLAATLTALASCSLMGLYDSPPAVHRDAGSPAGEDSGSPVDAASSADGGSPIDAGPVDAPPGEVCDDVLDNDGDGSVDCADPDCELDPACGVSGDEICDDGTDNDGDGRVDCDDSECDAQPPCA